MRICLVRTPSPFLYDDKAFPPLGLMSVATCLKINGVEVIIHDGRIEDIPNSFDGYGFGPTTPEYPIALEGKELIRRINKTARIVLGGSFATLNQNQVMRDGWDCVVTGDGEMASYAAFHGKTAHVKMANLPLDLYPIIDRSVINLSSYVYYLADRRSTSIVTSRGCPWHCAFCCKTEYNNSVRLRSAKNVNKEVDYLHNELGYNAVHIPDDIAIIDKERILEIAEHLGSLGMIWRCLVRGDLVVKYGERFVKTIADNGCIDVGMGIESGSNAILGNVDKRETVETMKQAVRMLNAAGITVKGYFILGLPGETKDTLQETEDFLEKMHLHDVDIKIYQPYPGSLIFANKDRYDIDWDDIDLSQQYYKGRQGDYHGTVRTSGLTNAEIAQAMNHLEGKFKRAS